MSVAKCKCAIAIPSAYTGKGKSKVEAASLAFSKKHFYELARKKDSENISNVQTHLYSIDHVEILAANYATIQAGYRFSQGDGKAGSIEEDANIGKVDLYSSVIIADVISKNGAIKRTMTMGAGAGGNTFKAFALAAMN